MQPLDLSPFPAAHSAAGSPHRPDATGRVAAADPMTVVPVWPHSASRRGTAMRVAIPRTTPRTSRLATVIAAMLSTALVAGCATYSARPLPTGAGLHRDVATLQVDASHIALPRLAAQRIDLSAPLSIDAVATLAVLNDPQLRAARDRLGIARAQAFAAGLLPDPQFSASHDDPGHSAGATTSAYSFGLSVDLGSLITRPAAVAAAKAGERQVDLDILWQEWQVAGQAQLLFVQLAGLQQRQALLQQQRDLIRARLQRQLDAVAADNLARPVADATRVELQAIESRLAAGEQTAVGLQAQLHALLGLDPAVPLRLGTLPSIPPESATQAHAALARIASVRPDLMALRAGYASAEQKLREAVLAQFPSVSVGFTRARDTTDVHTTGFGVSFNLPLFNGSRGAIAVRSATRKALYDDYRVRLGLARAGVEQALSNLAVLRAEQARLARQIPLLQTADAAARQALAQGTITLPQAQAQRTAWLDARLALLSVRQQIAEQAVALDLLTGSGLYRPRPGGDARRPDALAAAPSFRNSNP